MKNITILLLALLWVSLSKQASAQELTTYGLQKLPQHLEVNPGAPVFGKWYISMPVLSSVQFNAISNGWNYDDLFKVDPSRGDSLFLNRSGIESARLNSKNLLRVAYEQEVIGFGFTVKNIFFNFSSKVKTEGRFNYTKDLANLLKGNYDPATGGVLNTDLSGMDPFVMAYMENSIGASKDINDKLRVGLKLKHLTGIACLAAERSNLSRTTTEDYVNRVQVDYLLDVCAPVKFINKDNDPNKNIDKVENDGSVGDGLFQNTGFAFDLGASYRLNDKWLFGASLLDLGSISWSKNASQISAKGSYTLNGLDLTPVNGDISVDDAANKLSDGFEDSVKVQATGSKSFKTSLPVKLYLTADYRLNDHVSFSALYRRIFYQENPIQSLTLAAQTDLGKALSLTASYTAMTNLYNNFGAGVCFNAKAFQLYFVTDNLNSVFNLSSANAVNLRFGMNFVFGREKIVDKTLIDE